MKLRLKKKNEMDRNEEEDDVDYLVLMIQGMDGLFSRYLFEIVFSKSSQFTALNIKGENDFVLTPFYSF